jgi:hypothetical protein
MNGKCDSCVGGGYMKESKSCRLVKKGWVGWGFEMPFCLRDVLSVCRPHIKTTLVGHVRVRPEMAP